MKNKKGFSISRVFPAIAHNGLQLNADFVLHKICDLGAVITSRGLFSRNFNRSDKQKIKTKKSDGNNN